MDIPTEYKYSKSHEYLNIEDNKIATIGITNYASNELGDIVFVELPEVGSEFKAGEKFGVVESVKSVSDLYLPIDGKIVEINSELEDSPQYVNEEPYGKGWMIKVEAASGFDSSDVISPEEYTAFIKN